MHLLKCYNRQILEILCDADMYKALYILEIYTIADAPPFSNILNSSSI
jgi:hypothetical protein